MAMRAAIIAAIVATLVSSASATAAFVVTSANIKNGTIQLVDLNGKTKQALKGRRGPRGFEGLEGPRGEQGPPGVTPTYTNAYSNHATAAPGSFAFVNAVCPQGTTVVGGGHATDSVGTAKLIPTNSYPITMADGRGAWYVVMHNDGPQPEQFWATAYCVRTQ
jgi:hypothetical protein